MYQTCIFDLYGTLADIHTDEEKPELWAKLALFYGYYGARYTGEELQEAYRRLTGEMAEKDPLRKDSHEAYPEIRLENVFLQLFAEKDAKADMTLAVHAGQFFRALSTDYVRLYAGVKELLANLKEQGKALYLLTNAQKIFTEYELFYLGIHDCFDGILISSEAGVKKPDLRFFEKLLDTYGIDRETAVMVGNDGICDIRGAKGAGLATVYIRSNLSPEEELPEADHILEQVDMTELEKIITGII